MPATQLVRWWILKARAKLIRDGQPLEYGPWRCVGRTTGRVLAFEMLREFRRRMTAFDVALFFHDRRIK